MATSTTICVKQLECDTEQLTSDSSPTICANQLERDTEQSTSDSSPTICVNQLEHDTEQSTSDCSTPFSVDHLECYPEQLDVESLGHNLEIASSEVALKSPLYFAPFRRTKSWPIFTLSIMAVNW
jgi:hypothetical protein